MTINTLDIAKQLVKGGHTQEQAEAQAQILYETVQEKLFVQKSRENFQKNIENIVRQFEQSLIIKLTWIIVSTAVVVTAVLI